MIYIYKKRLMNFIENIGYFADVMYVFLFQLVPFSLACFAFGSNSISVPIRFVLCLPLAIIVFLKVCAFMEQRKRKITNNMIMKVLYGEGHCKGDNLPRLAEKADIVKEKDIIKSTDYNDVVVWYILVNFHETDYFHKLLIVHAWQDRYSHISEYLVLKLEQIYHIVSETVPYEDIENAKSEAKAYALKTCESDVDKYNDQYEAKLAELYADKFVKTIIDKFDERKVELLNE